MDGGFESQQTVYLCNDTSGNAPGADAAADTGSDATVDGAIDVGPDVAPGAACTKTAPGTLRGSPIAITQDDSRLIAVNRDVGTVTIISVVYAAGGQPTMTEIVELSVGSGTGSLPSQVAIDACGKRAFVVLRGDQTVVSIENLDTTPTVGSTVAVGSEPTALALTPNGTALYVSNWVDGTLTVIDPATMTQTATIDLNGPLVATGTLGPNAVARPALAHPRGIAITNNGDTSDTDETVLVTEWYAARTSPESASGTSADTTHEGLLYEVGVGTTTVATVSLPPVTNTGFADVSGQGTGCYPNQVASVAIDDGYAYVTSTCASPAGPLGVFLKNGCVVTADCASVGSGSMCLGGACTQSCAKDSDCSSAAPAGTCSLSNGTCAPETASVMTTTHPAVSIVNLSTSTGTTVVLDKLSVAVSSLRMPLLPTDIGFTAGVGYLTAEGSDALFALTASAGTITSVGSTARPFIDLHENASDTLIRLPMGIAVGHSEAFAFVEDEGTRDVTAIDLTANSIAGSGTPDLGITASSALPAAGSLAASQLSGKRFFNTGLGRWSLNGAAWGSCSACHVDGLSDSVTWYSDRGPRQSVSLDGTFSKTTSGDQRILTWTGGFDEIADFEAYVRSVSGGVGAIVSTASSPPVDFDRIDLGGETPPQVGLEGSSNDAANPSGTSAHPHSINTNWIDIGNYIQTIRSPARPTTLAPADVGAGSALFSSSGCGGCHSGGKWTISSVFYTPGDTPNAVYSSQASSALQNVSWSTNLNGFPASLLPSTPAGSRVMLQGLPPTLEQIECTLRPVGTISLSGSTPVGVSPSAVNVLEVRQDMVTAAQGAGVGGVGIGFNPPSLLGTQVGAPYFHAGNARTLEEAFSSTFQVHLQSLDNVFSPSATQVRQLVAYILSIDASETSLAVPAVGSSGGNFCHYP